MSTQTNKAMPPLLWAAGIAIILFSVVGIAAFMGWIPSSIGNTAEQSTRDKLAASNERQDTPDKTPEVKVHKVHKVHEAHAPQVVNNVHSNSKMICSDCGMIESTQEIVDPGKGGAVGIVGGAVVGGLLGHQVGGGRGKDIATVAGAVGGAVAGNEIQKRVDTHKRYETVVRFEDGSSRVFTTENATHWRSGDHVRVVNGEIRTN